MPNIKLHHGPLSTPITVLEKYFQTGGVTIISAAFAHSYFIAPEVVRKNPVYFPQYARRSNKHYPGLVKGNSTTWGENQQIIQLDVNQHAQRAWEMYTGRALMRRSGYSIRHIWGNPWNPNTFTVGWNLCYMPFWAGMLTEQQNPHAKLEKAFRQASWDLYFRDNPVCDLPEFVKDPGMNLERVLGDQPILILRNNGLPQDQKILSPVGEDNIISSLKEIRKKAHQSWGNIHKAVRNLQGLDHELFGTSKVGSSAKSCVRRIQRETGITFAELEKVLPTSDPSGTKNA